MTLRALLFADLVDSTKLVEQIGDVRAAELWERHDRQARDLLARCGGQEIDRADGFFLLFEDPTDAARFALSYHRALATLDLRARIGLHVGPVTLRHNLDADVRRGAKPTEVEGLAKPLAARVMALAGGGQTLLTDDARRAIVAALPEGAEIESHGHYRVKGVEAPLPIFELGLSGLTAFEPPADVDKAYRVVRVGDLWHPLREVRQNLPSERDSFIGRTAELRALAKRLDGGARLLTVVGPGGGGKTRLVQRYGLSWLGEWPGGIYFCDLSEARSLDGIYFVVAATLGVSLGTGDSGIQLGHAIASRGRCLIVLDNFEQLLVHAAPTVGRWVDRAPDAAFVVTSRELLHLRGEDIFPLDPLDVDKDGVELFAARARAQRPGFVLDQSNRDSVAEVVRLLDGLPLAIELAAARVRMFSPAQLVERMRDRFRILAGARGSAARQTTLAAAIDWSWNLLTDVEQAALAQCSVFEGGFSMRAAEAVLDLSDWPDAPAAMDVVQALLDKSLLRSWSSAEQQRLDLDEPYFGMYLSVHEYAIDRLGADAARALETRTRHGNYFASFGTDEATAALFQHGGPKRLAALALEIDNLVVACRRASAAGQGDTAAATYRAAWAVLQLTGPFALAVELGAHVLAIAGTSPSSLAVAHETLGQAMTRLGRTADAERQFSLAVDLYRQVGFRSPEGRALRGWGEAERQLGRLKDARLHCEQALAIHRTHGSPIEEGGDLLSLGAICLDEGALDDARAHYTRGLEILREVGDRLNEALGLGNLGNVAFEAGQMDAARAHYEAAIAIEKELNNRSYAGFYLNNLANLHHEQGRLGEALPIYLESLAVAREVGDRRNEGRILSNLGYLYGQQGRMEESQASCSAALAAHREVGNRRSEAIVLTNLGSLRQEQGRLGDARSFFEESLALHRELGNEIGEAGGLTNVASIDLDDGRLDDAAARLEQSLAINRGLKHRLGMGTNLGLLAEVWLEQGKVDDAKNALTESEALLREIQHPLTLARVLAIRGRIEVAEGRRDAASATLGEAQSIAATIAASPDSKLGVHIATLQRLLTA